MAEPTTTQLLEQLTLAKDVPSMAKLVARLLATCGIFNYQGIGHELARMSVTSDRDGFRKQQQGENVL